MDSRTVLLFCLAMFLAVLAITVEGRTKKVVIHVPYKVKKIRHTHTVFKTVHHHHKHHDFHDYLEHPGEEHEHFHHLLDETAHSQPKPSITIPEFLPDLPLNDVLDSDDDVLIPTRHMFYRQE